LCNGSSIYYHSPWFSCVAGVGGSGWVVVEVVVVVVLIIVCTGTGVRVPAGIVDELTLCDLWT